MTFVDEHGLARIGLLKVDAEGHDLRVLIGFRKMLAAANVDLVEAEVGMNPENKHHASFEAVKVYLERFGYRLFLIYEQIYDVPFSGRAVLRRSNVVFVSEQTARVTTRLIEGGAHLARKGRRRSRAHRTISQSQQYSGGGGISPGRRIVPVTQVK